MKRRRHSPEQIVRKLREADKMLAEGSRSPRVSRREGLHLPALSEPEVTVSRHPAPVIRLRAGVPVGEEVGLPLSGGGHEVPCLGGAASQSFVFAHGPAHQVLVDAVERPEQLGAVEGTLVVDPASHVGVHRSREIAKGRAAAQVQPPASDRVADRFRGLVRDRRAEADEHRAAFAEGCSGTKRVAQEVELLVLVRAGAVRVLAVHDARLVRIALQTDLRQPLGDRVEHDLRLRLAVAVQDHIVCVALERDARELPAKPQIERIVQEDGEVVALMGRLDQLQQPLVLDLAS